MLTIVVYKNPLPATCEYLCLRTNIQCQFCIYMYVCLCVCMCVCVCVCVCVCDYVYLQ